MVDTVETRDIESPANSNKIPFYPELNLIFPVIYHQQTRTRCIWTPRQIEVILFPSARIYPGILDLK